MKIIDANFPKQAPATAVAWLNAILRERFHPRMQLAQPAPGHWFISVPGSLVIIRMASDYATFSQAHSNLPCSNWNAAAEGWRPALPDSMPAPGAGIMPYPLIEKTVQGYDIHYDILGLTYWMLTRLEEVDRTDLDEHNRFPASSSHAYRYNYLERPIVDEWLAVLGQVMALAWPELPLIKHAFSTLVSHDVDTPARYGFSSFPGLLRAMAGDIIRRQKLMQAMLAPSIWMGSRNTLHASDPFNTFNWIMDRSEQHGLTSAFYFICGRTHASRDALYDPWHPAIRELMRRIHTRGHEVGLHPSYNTYKQPDAIASEAKVLITACQEEGIAQERWGGRMHFLRWQTPTTLYGWEQAGMAYDSTLTYAERPGFRCGTCHEYPAYDPVAGVALRLRIRPLIAMECTVMAPRYMNLGSGQAALNKFMKLKAACRAVNGSFTLLWHNTLLEDPAKQVLYQRILHL